MELFTVSEEAAQFYKKEMQLAEGDSVRLFARVGGVGSGGFSAGVEKGRPGLAGSEVKQAGIFFFVTDEDAWYFRGVKVIYDYDIGEIVFYRSGGMEYPDHEND
ncbi:hypothetical protein [Alkalicoccus luteus]|uniref:hypothetical protein n=1 Tax=Alkalicoccus luteus TaxID=1237094 RepID=UPI00197B72D8|nr:hypothetical protein [Alkalicoccus luteus]